MRSWVNVAALAKPKNLDGGLVARSAAGLPFLLKEGMEVAFVPPALDAPRRARVESVAMRGENEALVFFEGVTSIEAAEKLAGGYCLARRADVPEEALLGADAFNWNGWQVEDAVCGRVGTVACVEERPGQLMMTVACEDGTEALIPLVDEFIVEIDELAQIIHMNLPTGLLEL